MRLAVLGSTGSIGVSTLEVVRHHPDRLAVETLAAFGSDLEALQAQVAEFQPRVVAVYDAERARAFESNLPGTRVVSGSEGLIAAATAPGVQRVVAAMVGAQGLLPVYRALEAGLDVALANKECMVVAGRLLADLACRHGAELLPIDSEHVALHQALRCGERSEVRRLTLTASGGPFRTRPLETWAEITPQEALRHPTWEMGAKITIDSATLMNKALEVIEAQRLFEVPPDRIEVVVHPQSLVHSLVEFQDGFWIAQLSNNDMVYSIQYALAYPRRWANDFPRLEPEALGTLEFEAVDADRFPAIRLAQQALEKGDSGSAVLNAANEVAVEAFLQGNLLFPAIVETVSEVVHRHSGAAIDCLEDALEWDRWGREEASRVLAAN